MENVKLKLSKWDDGTSSYYLEDYCTSIKLSNSFSQIASELSFELPYATLSSSILALNIEMGDRIEFLYKDNRLFVGRVIDTDLKGKAQTLSVNCYDYTWWICKSNITKNFNNISVYSALEQIYIGLGATYYIDDELGDNGKIMIKSHLVKKKPASKVLYAIYSEVRKITGVSYYMHTDGDGATVTITEADKYYSGITIQPPTSLDSVDGNLIDYEINESMQNMVTRIEFHKSTGEVYADIGQGGTISLDDTNMGRYGVIQEIVEIDDDDSNATKALDEGNRMLSNQGKPSEELTVICFGDIGYKVAHGVMVKIPNTNYYDKFMYIVSSEWDWNEDGTFISKLILSPSKNQNLEDWTSVEEIQDGTTNGNSVKGSTSDLVNRIIAELKSHLGLAYKWGGKSPAYGGMDCSGYVSYVYNQFADELEITSKDGLLTSTTYSMINEGKDVTSDFPNNLRECDIIFPSDHHVVAYIGNNQIIEEPSSGKVCRIVNISEDSRFNNPLKVIRVVPDSAWITSSDSTGAFSDSVSNNLVEFIKGYEKFEANAYLDSGGVPTIGYGSTDPDNVAKGSCTESEATQWLKDEINEKASELRSHLDSAGISLPQNKFDALADFCFNSGFGGLQKSGLWDFAIGNSSKSSSEAWMVYLHDAAGNYLEGLRKRRIAEQNIWDKGEYDSTH